eukprot:9995814-Alexandrium_andersonii.AAC.1
MPPFRRLRNAFRGLGLSERESSQRGLPRAPEWEPSPNGHPGFIAQRSWLALPEVSCTDLRS